MFEVEIRLKVPKEFMNVEAFTSHMAKSMPAIAREGRDYWRTLAGQRLKSSRNQYQKAVKIFDKTETGISFGLEGVSWLMALETGSGGFELHPNTPYGKVIPLNTKGLIYPERSKNVEFRTKTKTWWHPGFEDGVNIREDVAEEMVSNIIPKYIEEAMAKCLGTE